MNQLDRAQAFSLFGRKLTARSGILELMDDLGRAMTVEPHMRMLGGGNPAAVPEFQAMVQARMREMLEDGGAFDRMLANYDPPQGNPRFVKALAGLLQRAFGWDVGPQNIAVTCGGQSAFFYLFNLLGGRFEGEQRRKILLPLVPEYIGYADQGIEEELFLGCRPLVEWPEGPEGRVFKYRINFPAVEEALGREKVGAIALSRPTNPSGNVVSDAEIAKLSALAADGGVPLIIDNAYGAPFPGILFTAARPFWTPETILTLSLSKLGLPGARTGIVIGPEKIVSAMSAFTAIVGLANNNVGQQMVLPWIESGRILEIGPGMLRPFYEARSEAAARWTRECMEAAGVDWAMHKPEGAFFHWLWLKDLRVSTREFYDRLKGRKVVTVPGEYFFYGLEEDWPQRRQCLRLNISQPADVVREGLEIIASEAAALRR